MSFAGLGRLHPDHVDAAVLREVKRTAPLDIADDETFDAWLKEDSNRTLDEFAYFELVAAPIMPAPPPSTPMRVGTGLLEASFVRVGEFVLPARIARDVRGNVFELTPKEPKPKNEPATLKLGIGEELPIAMAIERAQYRGPEEPRMFGDSGFMRGNREPRP